MKATMYIFIQIYIIL